MKLLAVYLDAWPYRYLRLLVNAIEGIDNEFKNLRLIPVYGYTDCFKVTLLTGKYPNEHNYWISYKFTDEPKARPIPTTLSCILDREVLPVRTFRFILSKAISIHMFHLKTWKYININKINPETSFIDIDKYLRIRGMNTLFSFIESKNLSYITIEDHLYRHKLEKVIKLVIKKAKDLDVVFLYIDEPDFWGHRYGPDSPRYMDLLRWLSRLMKSLIKLAKIYRSSYIVFSDHGMTTVRKFIDVYNLVLKDDDYGKKYVIGIDATFLRIFNLEDKYRESNTLGKLRNILSEHATLLDEQKLEEYHLPKDRSYGDEIYALREGIILYPNFFSWLKSHGMHAYDPKSESQHGIVLVSSDIQIKDDMITVPELHKLFTGVISKL